MLELEDVDRRRRPTGRFGLTACIVASGTLLVGWSASDSRATASATLRTRAASYTEAVVFRFPKGGGSEPWGRLLDKSGVFYGAAQAGAGLGSVFELTPSRNGYREKALHVFRNAGDGGSPLLGVIVRGGALYGTTTAGGTGSCNSGYGCGEVFSISRSGDGYAKRDVYDFRGGADGDVPSGGLIDVAGVLFGTTFFGGGSGCQGSAGCGTVFAMRPSKRGYIESVIHPFRGNGSDGAGPSARLLDRAGVLYGTTSSGGGDNVGTVFKLTPSDSGYTESIVHSFGGPPNDGAVPLAALVADESGALYGTTWTGGTDGLGSVFKLTPSGSGYTERIIYSFDFSSGAYPRAALLVDKKGVLYGTAQYGGIGGCYGNSSGSLLGCGTAFALTPSADGYGMTVLHRFRGGRDGAFPFAALISDGTGMLFGTTISGGDRDCVASYTGTAGCGTVFKLTPYLHPAVAPHWFPRRLSPEY